MIRGFGYTKEISIDNSWIKKDTSIKNYSET
jgi:hypothetical protein